MALSADWIPTQEKIQEAVDRIVAVGRPRRVIVFGSAARGHVSRNSDLDILVVTDEEVASSRQESVRLRRALRGIAMAIDVLVISQKRLRELADQAGLVYREALRTGKVMYDAAQ